MAADRSAGGAVLRGAAAVGAFAALALAHLLWFGHRSDLAARAVDWDGAARARGVAAKAVRFVPGGTVDLLPDLGLSLAAREKVLPEGGQVLARAVAEAPHDHRLWRALLHELQARGRTGAADAARALTSIGRGDWDSWIAAGDVHLAEGRIVAAVDAYREAIRLAAPQGYDRMVYQRLLDAGAPLGIVIDALPRTELNQAQLIELLMKTGEPETTVAVARRAAEEFPGSKRIASMLDGAEGYLARVTALQEGKR